ncbi:MAG: amino acid adenylation domain-containing protein, partial [Ramlibacter sp.]|nr:amino acid adenylation domain-containing protein [Ramlibacter sp.]
AGQSEANPSRVAIGLASHHLAYAIYTSGSTGQPKGVMVEHRNVCNQVRALQHRYELNPQDRVLQFASIAFDMSVEELFGALLSGCAVILRTDRWLTGAQGFLALCECNAISVANLPTIFWQSLELDQTTFYPACLRQIMIGGGPVEARALAAWFNHHGYQPKLFNAYGPTEATVNATIQEVSADRGMWRSIGRPIANTRVYLLDGQGQPVAIGVAGEIYIAGDGVARGYLNRPDLTAERFMADPFNDEAHARMYKTGDLGRYLADGNLEYLGRNDFQVKIRGFRIELGEIEAQLMRQAGIRDAAVLAREDSPGDKRLVAYCVLDREGSQELDAQALRSHLGAVLPEYMVPAAYVVLESLPLTPNGKLDRKALPAPEAGAYAAREYEAAAGEVETTLAALWCELLQLERVGRHDDFFELGGHSLLAVRLVSRLRQELGVELGLGELFEHPVLWALAQTIAVARRSELPPITPVERGQPLALSFAQQRLWFLAQLDGQSQAYHMPAGLHLSGQLDRGALRRALDRIVARHEALRTSFVLLQGQPVQHIAAPDIGFTLHEHDLSGHADALGEAQRLAQAEASAEFDLEQGPLIRGRLLVLGEEEHVLLVTMHHIVSDGWSMGVFTRELGVLYGAFAQGQDDPLPALAIQYADYAAWQRRWLEGEELQRQSAYWQARLGGAPALLELPTDRARPAHQDHRGATLGVQLDEQLTAALKALSQRQGTTLYMTLLAAWAALLGRLSGQDDIVIGTPVANRMRVEVEGLIGFFVNTLALRLDLSGSPSTVELLGRVKGRTLDAQEHQDLPFEQVVELAKPVRSMAHSALFQVMFSWQNNEQDTLELPGLQLQGVGTPTQIAKFDLSLDLSEAGGRIAGVLEYATALFDGATIERWAGYLENLLRAMVAKENEAVDRLELLGQAERHQLLVEWNATQAEYPREQCVHELFEAQAAQRPEAVAVVHEDRQLSYGELNAQATRLAWQLISCGVKPGAKVATQLERSIELVIAQLAILKCAAAYVPLERQMPLPRQAFIIEDSQACCVLSTSAAVLPEGVQRLDIDALLGDEASGFNLPHNPAQAPGGQAPAYVMYTSGSTGQPKGVVVPHRAIARLVINNGYARFEANDRVAFAANPAFDASTMEVWAPLLNGGRIVVIEQATLLAPQAFSHSLRQHGVNVLWLTVGLFNQYAQALAEVLPRLRYLVVGGDALDAGVIRGVLANSAPQHLINGYGPTESTVFAITHHVQHVDQEARSVPIGRPIGNTRVYLLDGQGQPVPIGVAGEIYIAGDGLALGYLNRPDLTAERFMADPFNDEAHARMYKTGDLGRYLADGNLE